MIYLSDVLLSVHCVCLYFSRFCFGLVGVLAAVCLPFFTHSFCCPHGPGVANSVCALGVSCVSC